MIENLFDESGVLFREYVKMSDLIRRHFDYGSVVVVVGLDVGFLNRNLTQWYRVISFENRKEILEEFERCVKLDKDFNESNHKIIFRDFNQCSVFGDALIIDCFDINFIKNMNLDSFGNFQMIVANMKNESNYAKKLEEAIHRYNFYTETLFSGTEHNDVTNIIKVLSRFKIEKYSM